MKYYNIAFGLPLSFSVGTAISPIKTNESELMVALDAVKPQDGPQYLFSGAEFTLMKLFAVRGGWKFNYSGTDDGGTATHPSIRGTIEGLSLGAGLKTTVEGCDIGVDYSFTKMDVLSGAHRISLQIGIK